MRIRIDKPIRARLLDELRAQGIAPLTPEGTTILQPDAGPPGSEGGDTGGWLTVPDAQAAAAQAVIAAHNAAAIDAAKATVAQQDTDDLAKIRATFQSIKDTSAALRADAAAMPPTLTAAQERAKLIQLENAVADQGDAVAALLRFVGRHMSG